MPLNDLTWHRSAHPLGGISFSSWKA